MTDLRDYLPTEPLDEARRGAIWAHIASNLADPDLVGCEGDTDGPDAGSQPDPRPTTHVRVGLDDVEFEAPLRRREAADGEPHHRSHRAAGHRGPESRRPEAATRSRSRARGGRRRGRAFVAIAASVALVAGGAVALQWWRGAQRDAELDTQRALSSQLGAALATVAEAPRLEARVLATGIGSDSCTEIVAQPDRATFTTRQTSALSPAQGLTCANEGGDEWYTYYSNRILYRTVQVTSGPANSTTHPVWVHSAIDAGVAYAQLRADLALDDALAALRSGRIERTYGGGSDGLATGDTEASAWGAGESTYRVATSGATLQICDDECRELAIESLEIDVSNGAVTSYDFTIAGGGHLEVVVAASAEAGAIELPEGLETAQYDGCTQTAPGTFDCLPDMDLAAPTAQPSQALARVDAAIAATLASDFTALLQQDSLMANGDTGQGCTDIVSSDGWLTANIRSGGEMGAGVACGDYVDLDLVAGPGRIYGYSGYRNGDMGWVEVTAPQSLIDRYVAWYLGFDELRANVAFAIFRGETHEDGATILHFVPNGYAELHRHCPPVGASTYGDDTPRLSDPWDCSNGTEPAPDRLDVTIDAAGRLSQVAYSYADQAATIAALPDDPSSSLPKAGRLSWSTLTFANWGAAPVIEPPQPVLIEREAVTMAELCGNRAFDEGAGTSSSRCPIWDSW